MIYGDCLPTASHLVSWLRVSLRLITKRHSRSHAMKKRGYLPTQAESTDLICHPRENKIADIDSDCIAEYVFSVGDNDMVLPYVSTSVGSGSIHGSPMNVPIEEIMLIGATNASGTGSGNTPIRQGPLKSPAPISSSTACELLTNGTLATMSN